MSFEQQMSPVLAGNENKKKKFKVTVVDESSNVDSEAMDIADSKMTASKEEMQGFKGFLQRIWKHNLARPHYRRKEFEKARAEILERKKLYGNAEEQKAHEKALMDQFSSEYDELIHTEVGEKREKLGVTETEMQIKSEIKKLISDYIEEKVTDETFPAEQARIFSQIKDAKKDVVDKGVLYSSNLLEIAKQVKQSLAHGEALDNLDLDFDVVVGKAKSGVRTEAQFNALDKIIDKIEQRKFAGSFVNETTVSTAVSVAYCTAIAVSKRFASSKLLAWGTFGATALLGAGIAAAREKKHLEDEKRQHSREKAQGKENEAGSERREKMERYRYETKNATSLSDDLEYSLYNFNEKGEREPKTLDQQSFQAVIGKLAEIESRSLISDRQKLDLISFSKKSRVIEERARMDFLRIVAKKDLANLLANSNGNLTVPKGKNFSEFLQLVSETKAAEIKEGIEKQNKLFNEMRNNEVWKAGFKGLATGVLIGGAAQEIGAFFQEGQEGFFEVSNAYAAEAQQAAPAVQSYTFLEYVRRCISGDLPRMDASKIHEILIGNNHVKLPEGANLVQNSNGTFNLLRGTEVVGENIKFNPDGSLSDEAKKILMEKGIGIESDTVTSNPKDIVNDHEDLSTKIKRVLWYDNDTPKPVFDKNELKLHWGGESGTGVDSHGNYVFNIKHMAPDGSYHGKFSVDAQEAMKSGKLKMLLSLSRDTQNQVFEVPIDAKGNAVIDPNSEIGKLFFQNEGGHAKFMGRFAEVAEIMGKKDGTDMVRLLSTLEGKGVEGSTDLVTILDLPADYNVEPPPFVPIIGRRPLEKTKEPDSPLPQYPESVSESGYEGSGSEDERKTEKSEKNKELRIATVANSFYEGNSSNKKEISQAKKERVTDLLLKFYQDKVSDNNKKDFVEFLNGYSSWLKGNKKLPRVTIEKKWDIAINKELKKMKNNKKKKEIHDVISNYIDLMKKNGKPVSEDKIEWLVKITKILI